MGIIRVKKMIFDLRKVRVWGPQVPVTYKLNNRLNIAEPENHCPVWVRNTRFLNN